MAVEVEIDGKVEASFDDGREILCQRLELWEGEDGVVSVAFERLDPEVESEVDLGKNTPFGVGEGG